MTSIISVRIQSFFLILFPRKKGKIKGSIGSFRSSSFITPTPSEVPSSPPSFRFIRCNNLNFFKKSETVTHRCRWTFTSSQRLDQTYHLCVHTLPVLPRLTHGDTQVFRLSQPNLAYYDKIREIDISIVYDIRLAVSIPYDLPSPLSFS